MKRGEWGVVTVACVLLACVTALVMHKDLPLSALVAAGAAILAWFLKSPLASPVEQAVIAYVEARIADLQTKEAPGPLVPGASETETDGKKTTPAPASEAKS